MLFGLLPDCVSSSLFYKNIDQKMLESVIYLSEDQHTIRKKLSSMGLVAFIADGSVLPRESGISQKPLRNCVKFQSPDTYRVSFELPHQGMITGMGIPKGITLIVGGGYHGKSTLLKALELGVYDHVKGDGREFVITDPTAMKIRAEDGRSITNTDISMFINNLPNGKNTVSFDTEDASGSTSQAANVVEAMETDSSLFLIDEDTSATNFMIRDELMQRVVLRDQEPITPFIERIRELYERYGISSIIVAGSCGSYFHPADHIIQMDQYIPKDITTAAKDAAKDFPMVSLPEKKHPDPCFDRCFNAGNYLKKERKIKMKTLGKDAFSINKDTVDLRYVEQIADTEQTTALGYALLYAKLYLMDGKKDLCAVADELMQIIETKGLSAILDSKYVKSNLAMPRKQEVMAAMNRYRNL
jgi:predicted ABC-class ATPase